MITPVGATFGRDSSLAGELTSDDRADADDAEAVGVTTMPPSDSLPSFGPGS